MALIKCPHCGETVSDTANACIHCGKAITRTVEEASGKKLQEYTNLNASEKRKLKEEFQKAYPNQKDYEKREATLKLIKKLSLLFIAVGAGIVLLILLLAKDVLSPLSITGIVFGAVLFFGSDVIDIIVCPILIVRNKKKSLVALKLFQKWLIDNNGINYTVTFNGADKKWKNYFDSINLYAEGYKG